MGIFDQPITEKKKLNQALDGPKNRFIVIAFSFLASYIVGLQE